MSLAVDLGKPNTAATVLPGRGWRWPRGEGLLPFAVPVGLIVLWQLASSLGLITNRLMPAPADVALAFWTKAASGELAVNVGVSAARAIAGLVVGGSRYCRTHRRRCHRLFSRSHERA